MSQLLLRAIRSSGGSQGSRALFSRQNTTMRSLRTTALSPSSCMIHAHLQEQKQAPAHIRRFSQRAGLRLQQQQEQVEQSEAVVGRDDANSLFAPTNNSLIALNDMRQDTEMLHYLQTGKSLTEQLSMMQACLINGNADRAQRILIGMYKLYPEAMHEVVDVSIHNEIIGGLLAAKPRPLTTEALLWYDQMERHYKVEPNTNTFAILIGGFVRFDMRNVAVVLMQEMLRGGHNFRDLLLSSYLSDRDIEKIKEVARGILNTNEENVDVATKLLDAVKDAEQRLDQISKESGVNLEESSQGNGVLISVDSDNAQSSGLASTEVMGIQQLQGVLESLSRNDLEGYNLQLRLERDTYDVALARFKEINSQRGDPLLSTDLSRLKKVSADWLPQLELLIEEEQSRCEKAVEDHSDHARAQYGRFLLQLDAPKLAVITILEVLRMQSTDNKDFSADTSVKINGTKTVTLVTSLATAVHNEIRFENMKKRTNRHIAGRNVSVAKLASSGKLFNMTVRRAQAQMARDSATQAWLDSWDIPTKTRIGSLLLSMLIEAARIPEQYRDESTGQLLTRPVPAFTHSYVMLKGRKYGVVVPHGTLREMFRKDSLISVVNARHLPMLVPPRPWLTYNSGGYLTQNEPCMRMKESNEQLRYLKKASNEDRLTTLLAGLDSLGLTKWSINRPVFEAVRKVWNSGREIAEIPPSTYDVPEPAKPDDYDTNPQAKLKYGVEMKEWSNGRANQHSRRCDCNYKVEIARAFLDHPMYFPHNMDFRGRAYPIPPHFNHLGNDLCRGLLLFHEGRELTERGMYWLRIHLANLCGKDKLSHTDRLQFVEDNLAKIMQSADDPVPDAFLRGDEGVERPWWLEAEDPWQALAACIELANALRSPDPAKYVSHLHVHQDGTCNGLQHYAAMGRDTKGALEVNLMPSKSPQDVYSGILRVVERRVNEDAEQGVEEAKLLKDQLTRKIVKQTVMTNVYGVTLIGAKEQISARLREVKDEHGQHVFDVLKVSKLAMYVAKKIFESLGEMFTQAQQIQNWLNESARRVAKSMPASALAAWRNMVLENKDAKEKFREAMKDAKTNDRILDSTKIMELRPDLGPGAMRRRRLNDLATKPMTTVVWTTPLGLTVVQPYRRLVTRNVATSLQHIAVQDANMPAPVNSQKQKTAFPPNFVHSLDASHMILSAIECKKADLVFASVHDSYWTHACDVDRMNVILRDQFVQLHTLDIMGNLKNEFEERYKDHKMPVVCWEYVTKDVFDQGGKVRTKRRGIRNKQARQEQEKMVDRELAAHHLSLCDDSNAPPSVALTPKEQQVAADAAKHREAILANLTAIDMANMTEIDPKDDLLAAMRQADNIAYTRSINISHIEKEISAAKAAHKSKVSELRGLIKKIPAKGGKSSHKTDDATREAEPVKKPSKEERMKEIEQLKAQLAKDIAKIEKKYEADFEPQTIMVYPEDTPDLYQRVLEMTKSGELAGHLVQRTEWVDIKFDDLPKHGDFKIEEVLESPYFFS